MGKRSDFNRVERDFYPTPYDAIIPLLPHLDDRALFAEPCCGDGALVEHLRKHGHHPYWMSDIEPKCELGIKADALVLTVPLQWADCIITNPPWSRDILHPMIEQFRKQNTTWLLFDADWAHTKQSAPFIPYCSMIVSVGRLKWMPDSKMTGKDNCCWYRFHKDRADRTVFVGR